MTRRELLLSALVGTVTALVPIEVVPPPGEAIPLVEVPEATMMAAGYVYTLGLEDDLYSYYELMGRELGRAVAYTRQIEALELFNA